MGHILSDATIELGMTWQYLECCFDWRNCSEPTAYKRSMKPNLDLSCFCWFQLVFLWFTSHFQGVLSNYCSAETVLNATYMLSPHKCMRCVAFPVKNDGAIVKQTSRTDIPSPCGWIRLADILCCVHILLIANFELWAVNLGRA